MAGTGKSTISRTVAETFSEAKSLGASFFFKRGEADRGNAKRLFPTIARQLTTSIPQLLPYIKQAVHDNSGIIGKGLKEQFDKLLLQPLQRLEQSDLPAHTVVMVIDALDECEGDNDIRLIVQLLPQLQKLGTCHIRVLLTSRPELPVRLGFSKIAIQDHKDLILHEIPEEVIKHDISLFLHWRLSEIRNDSFLPDDWPGEKKLQELVSLSVPLFIFAATICRMFEDPNWDPVDSLTEILGYRHDKSQMDRTYLPVLARLLIGQTEKQKKQLVEEFQHVIGSIVILEEPLSVISISKLLNLPERLIQLRLKPLHSVLKIPTDGTLPVRLFHLSFRDFLLDSQTCKQTPLAVDEKTAHYTLTIQCLFMCQSLRRNICALPSDGARRVEVDRRTVDHYIPPELYYSCRYWVYHLVKCNPPRNLIHQAYLFLEEHFLHWVEAMSLLGFASDVVGMLSLLQKNIPSNQDSEISMFLYDAKRFILKNLQMADYAPLQLYSSGLIFAPQKAIVRRQFKSEIPNWICQLPQVEETWSSELQTLEGHSSLVNSVAFSPDSALLASGSCDSTIGLWDTATGTLQQTLDDNATYSVNSVAFSPDGRLLASASNDEKVPLWNLATGTLQQTLDDNAIYSVNSVAFSPDGRLLASASDDEKVRLWDLATGTLQQTLDDNSDSVNSVAFSPDGRLLASADAKVRLWDLATGTLQQTLDDNSSIVNSVAFSPDGRLLASAGEKVRLWDPVTGVQQQFLEGHSDDIHSVAFSPDGRLLASGSSDSTIRLWDPTMVAPQSAREGHGCPVISVKFSPDGQLLVSRCEDRTMGVWDSATGALLQIKEYLRPVKEVACSLDGQLLAFNTDWGELTLWDMTTNVIQDLYSDHTRSLTFSPDGQLLATLSWNEVLVWDSATGTLQQRLETHSDSAISVVFSPDCQLLASVSADQTAQLWDLATGTMQQVIPINGKITCFEFFTDGLHPEANSCLLDIEPNGDEPASNIDPKTLEISIEHEQWIKVNGKILLWLPPEYRAISSTIHGNTIAIGHGTGRVSFLGFCIESL
ncbi:unnamed protein product [Penicillium salamii]|nr:unnamed protein product [Penicillium salamii]